MFGCQWEEKVIEAYGAIITVMRFFVETSARISFGADDGLMFGQSAWVEKTQKLPVLKNQWNKHAIIYIQWTANQQRT